jgi:hypothetical protein
MLGRVGSRIIALSVVAALTGAAVAVAATSPATLYHSAVVAASAKRSVHYVATSTLGGDREVLVGDAGPDRGSQRVTFTHAGRTGRVAISVVANKAYLRGDAFALQAYVGLNAAQVAKYAGRWFVIAPPSGAFGAVAEAVRMPSFVAELLMPAPYTPALAATLAGRRVTGVASRFSRNGKSAVVTLYVAGGSPLPFAQVAKGPAGTVTTIMSRWNEPVRVAAPAGTLPFH